MRNKNDMHPQDVRRTPLARKVLGTVLVTGLLGSLASTVRLYGTTGGSGLADYLNVKVTRGTQPAPSFSSCAGFTADAADHRGLGAGVLYDGTLTGFADD